MHNIIVEKLSGVTCICNCVHSSSTPVFRTLSVLWILNCGWEYKNAKIWIFPFFCIRWLYPTIHSIRYISEKKVWNRLFTTTTISYFSDDKTLSHCFPRLETCFRIHHTQYYGHIIWPCWRSSLTLQILYDKE